eukprot:12120281-Prorocentrum_lima.AAC.1
MKAASLSAIGLSPGDPRAKFVRTPWGEKAEDAQFWDWATKSFQADAGKGVGMPPLSLILTSTQDE